MKIVNQTSFSLNKNFHIDSTLYADGAIDVNFNISKMWPEMHIRTEMYLDSGAGKYDLEIINRTINVCRLLRDHRYEPILQLMYKIVRTYGRVPTKCPIQTVNKTSHTVSKNR